MNKYDLLETIGEGAYGIVIKGKCKETGRLVAIKRFKESDEDELVRKTTLREVKILRALKDEAYVVKLLEAFRRKGRLYLVFEYVGKNLLELLEEHANGIPEAQLRRMVYSMLLSVYACHSNNVIHRDIKPENLLLYASDNTLRLCDFGFARHYTAGARDLTDYVATRWYRSPELLLGTTDYSLPSDIFAAGCIMAELIDGQPLFPGESEIDQMHLIQKLLGSFTPQQQDTFSKNPRFSGHQLAVSNAGAPEQSLDRRYGARISRPGMSLLKSMLVVDPPGRLTVMEALQHPYFDGLAAELCPQLIPILASVPVRGEGMPGDQPQQRPDTRDSGTRRGRSANNGGQARSNAAAAAVGGLPHTGMSTTSSFSSNPLSYTGRGTNEDPSGDLPAIGSRPQSRGHAQPTADPLASLPSSDRHNRGANNAVPTPVVGGNYGTNNGGVSSQLRNIGAISKPGVGPHSSSGGGSSGGFTQQYNPSPASGGGSGGVGSSHRSGSGHGGSRRGQSQPGMLPKSLAGGGRTGDVLDGAPSPMMNEPPAPGGYSSTPSYLGYKPLSHHQHQPQPQPPPGNLPRLGGGIGALPPTGTGNGPAPSSHLAHQQQQQQQQQGQQATAYGMSVPYNPFLAPRGGNRHPAPGGSGVNRFM